jgi:hypothetical protein
MKNWNDEGKVHFDAATNQRYTRVCLSFMYRERKWDFELAIPLAMRPSLKGEHYDQAILLAKRVIDKELMRCWWAGEFDESINQRTVRLLALTAMLEQLYNEFHLAQAQAGNNVWATPELMQDVGPRPENDPIN